MKWILSYIRKLWFLIVFLLLRGGIRVVELAKKISTLSAVRNGINSAPTSICCVWNVVRVVELAKKPRPYVGLLMICYALICTLCVILCLFWHSKESVLSCKIGTFIFYVVTTLRLRAWECFYFSPFWGVSSSSATLLCAVDSLRDAFLRSYLPLNLVYTTDILMFPSDLLPPKSPVFAMPI